MNKKLLSALAFGLMAMASLQSCGDSENVGSSIIQDEVEIVVTDGFTVTGHSVDNSRIQSRTITQLLGSIDATGFGSFSSDFVTQFMPAGTIDTTGVTVNDIDSLKLMLAVPNGGYVGDSITPMGLRVYRLTKQLPSPIYSDFDPKDYYDASKPISSKIYTCSALGMADSLSDYSYRFVYCDLPVELGRDLFSAYRANPAAYQSPTAFADVFPGLYITNSYGSGRVIKIAGNSMSLYYHKTVKSESTGRDSTYSCVGNYYAVTPEVVTNNNISFAMSDVLRRRAAAGEALVVAPAGLDVEIEFPIKQLLESYRANQGNLTVVNTLTFSVPVELITNTYGIAPPPDLLMVLSAKKDEFFQNNKVTDNQYSFYASYDSTNRRYLFSSLRNYFTTMLEQSQSGEISADDYTFTLTPVSVETETYTTSSYSTAYYISAIVPYIDTPAMAVLKLKDAKITLTYSKQSVKF
jgi:hypothetical protein